MAQTSVLQPEFFDPILPYIYKMSMPDRKIEIIVPHNILVDIESLLSFFEPDVEHHFTRPNSQPYALHRMDATGLIVGTLKDSGLAITFLTK